MTTRIRRKLQRQQARCERAYLDFIGKHGVCKKDWNNSGLLLHEGGYYFNLMNHEEDPPILKLSKYNQIKKIDDDPNHFYKDCGHDVVLKDGTEWYISPESFKTQLEESYKRIRFVGVRYINGQNLIWLAFKIWGLSYLGELCVPYTRDVNIVAQHLQESVSDAFEALFQDIPVKKLMRFRRGSDLDSWEVPKIFGSHLPNYEKAIQRELPKAQNRAMNQVWKWINGIKYESTSWRKDWDNSTIFDMEFRWPEMYGLDLSKKTFKLENAGNNKRFEDLVPDILSLLVEYLTEHSIDRTMKAGDVRAKAPNFIARIEPIFEDQKKKAHRREVKSQLRHWLEPAVREFSIDEIHEWIDEFTVSTVMDE